MFQATVNIFNSFKNRINSVFSITNKLPKTLINIAAIIISTITTAIILFILIIIGLVVLVVPNET